MSKMPAKKKSCFQITSVTPAQVAATGATDDTESLDDPEEARAEDVSAEIYSLPRAEFEPGCDGSSSEEALNNAGDSEVMTTLNTPHPGQLANPIGELRKVAASGSPQGGQQLLAGSPLIAQPRPLHQQSPPAAGVAVNSQPTASSAPPPAASTVSCTSRFRVIKLDHGIGEPFRRGRWTCTEFYEKDSEGPGVGRTADGVRHAGATPDPAKDREGGLGHAVGSGIAPSPHSGQAADAALSSPRLHLAETPPQQQIQYQNYSPRLQGVAGSTAPSAFSSSRPAAVPGQPTLGALQPAPPAGQNSQSGIHVQMSPVTYQPHPQHHQQHHQQHPVSHHLTHQSEYYQQQQPAPMHPGLAAGPSPPLSGLSAGPLASGGASVPGQAGDVAGVGGASGPPGQPGLLQQQTAGMGGAGASVLTGASALQQAVSPYAAGGLSQLHGLHPTPSSVPNVPAAAASSSVPAAIPSASSAASMPNVAASSLPPGQQPRSRTPVGLGVQGLPPAGFGYMEAGGGKPEDLFNSPSPIVPLMAEARPFMPESLQLATPTVNSLFGIHIPVDGEGNRNPSKAFYQAFQSGTRLRDSKARNDRASGTNVAAIDNKIEQAMDLVKSHLMYAVREEVEVLKEQIKELYERNSVLERENAVLKSLANSEQLSQLPAQSAATPPQPPPPQLQHHPKPLQLQTQPDPGQQPQPSVTSA